MRGVEARWAKRFLRRGSDRRRSLITSKGKKRGTGTAPSVVNMWESQIIRVGEQRPTCRRHSRETVWAHI